MFATDPKPWPQMLCGGFVDDEPDPGGEFTTIAGGTARVARPDTRGGPPHHQCGYPCLSDGEYPGAAIPGAWINSL